MHVLYCLVLLNSGFLFVCCFVLLLLFVFCFGFFGGVVLGVFWCGFFGFFFVCCWFFNLFFFDLL